MLRSRVVWTGVAGTPYYSNFYCSGNSPSLAADWQEATIEWASLVALGVVPSLSLTVDSEIVAINEETGEIITAYDVAGSTSTGERIGQPLPFRTQILTQLGTTDFRRGRRVRGRSFIGGLSEEDNITGTGPSESFRESIQATYTSSFGESPAVPVVWSRPIPPGPGEPGAIGQTSVITSYLSRTTWSSLRSRGA